MGTSQPFDWQRAGAGDPRGPMLLRRYRVERSLAAGGMGQVYLARDRLLDRQVALKRMLPTGEEPASRRKAILNEARRASRINDRRIASIYDVLELEDEVVLVMEYVEGVTLRERMAEPVPLDRFWSLAFECVAGIAVAHTHGVIHRDIKPENLMLTGTGEIKILDFGIAKRSERASGTADTLTAASTLGVAGTPQYMAPEAHLGGAVNERTDIFSLGVVFYELLTGKRPFEGPTYAAVVDKVLHATPPPVLDCNPAATPELSRVVERMLAKDPSQRFASASELMRELERSRSGVGAPPGTGAVVLAPSPDPAVPQPLAGPVATPARRRLLVRVGLPLLGVAVAAAGGVWWRMSAMTALPRNLNVAVLAPVTPGADGDFASFALGAAKLVSASLEKNSDRPGFQLASFADGLDNKVHSAVDARKILGADVALASRFEQGPDFLRARLDLVATDHSRVIASREIQTPRSEPFAFVDQLARESAVMLRLPAPARGVGAASGISGAGTLRFYLQGIGRLLAVSTADDAKRAAADFELACRTESDAAVPRAGLATAQYRVHSLTREPEWLANAEVSAREAIRLDSGHAEGHRILGSVLSSQKRLAEAVPEYTRASELDPTDDAARLALGKTYGRLGQPQREEAAYAAAFRRRPHDWRPHWWLGTWRYRHGHIDAAIGEFEAMTRCAPLLADGYAYLGGLLVLRGEYGKAISTLKQALALRPTEAAFDNLGTAYFNSGRLGEAADAYNQSLQFGFVNYRSWLNLGDAYYWQSGRRDQAAAAYAQGIRLAREELLARSQPGRTYDVTIAAALAPVFARLGEPDSARSYLAQALSADSSNSTVQCCAALTHWQLQDRDRALGWLARAVAGGYPTAWLKDSPMFRDWRPVAAFRALIAETGPAPQQNASDN